jgi:hypothetical protein
MGHIHCGCRAPLAQPSRTVLARSSTRFLGQSFQSWRLSVCAAPRDEFLQVLRCCCNGIFVVIVRGEFAKVNQIALDDTPHFVSDRLLMLYPSHSSAVDGGVHDVVVEIELRTPYRRTSIQKSARGAAVENGLWNLERGEVRTSQRA